MIRYFLIEFIKCNPGKLIVLLIGIISFIIWHNSSSKNVSYDVISYTQRGKEYIYVLSDDDNNLALKTFDRQQDVRKNVIVLKESSTTTIVSVVIVIVALAILFIGTVVEDDDVTWNINTCICRAIFRLTICEYENGYYHYVVNNRLLYRSDSNLSEYDIEDLAHQFRKNPHIFPKFKTTSKNREDRINKLLS